MDSFGIAMILSAGKSGGDFWIADILEQGIIINYTQEAEINLN